MLSNKNDNVNLRYSSKYDDSLLRGIEAPRPWDIVQVVKSYVNSQSRLLDIGSGTGSKLIQIAPSVHTAVGIEPNNEVRQRAVGKFAERGYVNTSFMDGVAEQLPFPAEDFDVATCMVAPHSTEEIARVLKPGGVAIVEKIGDRDKANIKNEFGLDEQGARGYLCDLEEGERVRTYTHEFKEYFQKVDVRVGEWETFYSFAGLCMLCEQAKTIRNFNREMDAHILNRIEQRYSTPKGIRTIQQRILIIAKK